MDFQVLQLKIEAAARAAFEQVRNKYAGQSFCGYALYSDSDAITVCPAVNSTDHLNKMIAGDPDDAIYYRWSPGEWDHEFEGAECFKDISNLLYNEVMSMQSAERHRDYKEKVYECCVAALESLKKEGFFSDMSESGVLVFTVSDDTNALECDWIARLNRNELAQEFQNWIGG
ncbi:MULTISPECIES: DUF4303 domain-containing protein [Brevibacillus]|uniref:DUF4303 domain-containing protein n=1 Tax=Brevibacillus brevis (strain 47 / JCM 6285 / NBRC 100599) TaxID=358681 RepID=C0ZA17_BREBN|nr:DUF4303 domain-containing protein [Brevibacillus brevis]BAH46871.1 hypothetical protein BBR47_58940 [Brevibacillus brevis NBRC 100599]